MAPNQNSEQHLKYLKSKLYMLQTKIKGVTDQGRRAATDSSQKPLFYAMFEDLSSFRLQMDQTHEEITQIYFQENREKEYPDENEKLKRENSDRYYFECKMLYNRLTGEDAKATLATSAEQTINLTSLLNDTKNSRGRLPKINLPNFNGNPIDWPHYRDTYEVLVHNDPTLNKIEKFHYLNSTLSGDALNLVKNLPIQEENYDSAWERLIARYNNKRILASLYIQRLFDFKPMTGKPTGKASLSSLRHFLDCMADNITPLRQLKLDDEAGFILFSLAMRCLDPSSRQAFEQKHIDVEFPTFDQLIKFITQQCKVLELSSSLSEDNKIPANTNRISKGCSFLVSTQQYFKHNKQFPTCFLCKENHYLTNCPRFKSMTPIQRFESIKNYPGCRYHLTTTHRTQDCKNKICCKYCQKPHNSLLHFSSRNNEANRQLKDDIKTLPNHNPSETSSSVMTNTWQDNSDILLSTAIVHLQDSNSMFKPIRVLLDSGSQCTLITESCANSFHLHVEKGKRNLSGVGQHLTEGIGTVHCVLKPRNSRGPLLSTQATVVPKITGKLPTSFVPFNIKQKIASYALADPNFFEPRDIDVLLGADLFWKIVRNGVRRIEGEEATLMKTVFGWVVLGRIHNFEPRATASFHILNPAAIDNLIEKFWELEEPVSPKIPSNPEDVACENHFNLSHYRLPSGRYGVRLPFRSTPPDMLDGRQQVLKRFFSLESKFIKNQEFKNSYSLFMEEYRQLGHMEPTNDHAKYIIPHHGVFKSNSPSTKLRVVFDASMRCKLGSLNDYLYTGPKLQLDIADIILNFRIHEIAFTADICKMYRQIELHKDDRCYQHIFWRSSSNEELQEFELTTVTYGISASPFLALRVIKQLTMDEGKGFPEAVQVLSRDMYVDDIVTGSDSLEGAIILQKQLIGILEKGGFQLRKWASNSQVLLNEIPKENREQSVKLNPKCDVSVKILGMHWDPSNDMFSYHIHDVPTVTTKRSILSTIARIYDPLGYLSPVVFFAKVIMQELWKHRLKWDDPIPRDINKKWLVFIQELKSMSDIQIPRSLKMKTALNIQLIGFCDASQLGYAAMIFLRVEHTNGDVHVSLLKAKTKLAPIKTITIPRLELCGAHLLALLYDSLKDFLRHFNVDKIFMFTDSTIVLGWLNTLPHKLNIYVANRIIQILEKTEKSYWFYVDSSDNPADGASRGMTPFNFLKYSLWWTGPKWLLQPTCKWPNLGNNTTNIVLPELKLEKNVLLTSNIQTSTHCWCNWLEKFSSFPKLLRVIAYILRFIQNLKSSNSRTTGALTVPEIQLAEVNIIRWTQQQYFSKYFSEPLICKVKELSRLTPFLDSNGLLRVGGRLRHSDLHYDSKHPILLPQKCHFSKILVDYYHHITLHGGLHIIQSALRQKYWILSSRRLIKCRIFKCLKCFKLKAKPSPPLMGNLPPARFTSGRAFLNVGVDYAGPFQLKFSSRRNSPTTKGYLCLFICLATRALHLEIVSSLSTDAFLASMDRFIARRGKPIKIYSDCGTNFVGAAREMKELSEWFRAHQDTIGNHLVAKEIVWHFNPPATPHFGGIWEAGVKSVKHHLIRTVSSTPYTFEEFYTLVVQIEAILNSRPLYPLSSEPEDFQYLTPSHFLIGDCLTSRPTHDWANVAENRLNRWQLIQQRTQHFWTKWRHDYLNTLQQKIKWTKQSPYSPKIGDLVLIHDKTASPLSWPTARITALHKGVDEVVRVVTIKTANREFQRPVVNLIPLLKPENDEQF